MGEEGEGRGGRREKKDRRGGRRGEERRGEEKKDRRGGRRGEKKDTHFVRFVLLYCLPSRQHHPFPLLRPPLSLSTPSPPLPNVKECEGKKDGGRNVKEGRKECEGRKEGRSVKDRRVGGRSVKDGTKE